MLAVAFGPAGGGLTSCLKLQRWVFLGGPVVKTLSSNAGVVSLIPGLEAKIQHASREKNPKQRTETNYNKFSKDFKNGPHQKKLYKIEKNKIAEMSNRVINSDKT